MYSSSKSRNQLVKAKLVLVGESSTGKTSLLHYFAYRNFNETEISTSTPANIRKVIDVDGGKVELDLWDTAGQEKFRSLNRRFYHDANIGILVYSVTDRNSFDNLKSFWHQELLEQGDNNIIIGIAANKNDLFIEAEVEEENGKDFADIINAEFEATSCKMGTGVVELFNKVAQKFFDYAKDKPEYKKNIALNKDKSKGETNKKKCC